MSKATLILGAGPAGITAGYQLARAGKPPIIIEKNECVGGLSRTLQYEDFLTDIGPHRFFSQNQSLYTMIEELLGNDWVTVNRLTRFYVNNRFFLYPLDIKDALKNIGLIKGGRILGDYFYQKVKKCFHSRPPVSFEEKIVADFGRTLAELNMLNYTEKIWGLPCTEISPDWATQRIKGLSILAVFKKALQKTASNGPKSLVDEFAYPRCGTSMIYEAMREAIIAETPEKNGSPIHFMSHPRCIHHAGNAVTEVTICNEAGIEQTIPTAHLVSTIPITELINLFSPAVPEPVRLAAHHLQFRAHRALFIMLNKPRVFPDQWIYLPDKEIPFGRIMEPKNFSSSLTPEGKTSLLLEFFCWEGDRFWNASDDELVDLSLPWLEQFGFIRHDEIAGYYTHRERYAYPVYDLTYLKHLTIVKEYLAGFTNLIATGRSGAFRYNNQDHALEMGLMAARSIIDGTPYEGDLIGTEQTYLERGNAHERKTVPRS